MTARGRTTQRLVRAGMLLVLLGALFAALHHLLARNATRIVKRQIIARAERELGVAIHLGHVRMHPLRGHMALSDVRILNPPGFAPPELAVIETTHLHLRLLPLLRGTLDLSALTLTNATLTLVRNEAGNLNLTPSPRRTGAATADIERSRRPQQAGKRMRRAREPRARRRQPVKATLERLTATTVFSYLDYTLADGAPLAVSFDLAVEGRNLGSAPEAEAPWGDLSLRGHLHEDPTAFVTDLHARIAPLVQPRRASFDLSGTIDAIRPAELGAAARAWEVGCESADLALSVRCRAGVFTDDSLLTLTLRQPRLSGRLARKARNMPLPPELVLEVPLRGALGDPKLDIQTALVRTVLANLSGSLGTLLESTTIDGKKLDGDLGEAAQKLGEILKNWK